MEKIRKLYEHMCKLEKKKELLKNLEDLDNSYVFSKKEEQRLEKLQNFFKKNESLFNVNYKILANSCLENLQKLDKDWRILFDYSTQRQEIEYFEGTEVYTTIFYEIFFNLYKEGKSKKIDFCKFNEYNYSLRVFDDKYNQIPGEKDTKECVNLISNKNGNIKLNKYLLLGNILPKDIYDKELLEAIRNGVWQAVKKNYYFEKNKELEHAKQKLEKAQIEYNKVEENFNSFEQEMNDFQNLTM